MKKKKATLPLNSTSHFYNTNREPVQTQILSGLCNNLHGVEDVEIKNIGLGGDLVYFFILTLMF